MCPLISDFQAAVAETSFETEIIEQASDEGKTEEAENIGGEVAATADKNLAGLEADADKHLVGLEVDADESLVERVHAAEKEVDDFEDDWAELVAEEHEHLDCGVPSQDLCFVQALVAVDVCNWFLK